MAFLVTVLSAFDLRDARMFGNVQPYAEVEVNGRKQRSKTDRQRGATPDWRHGFRFTAGPDDVLTLVVYDDQLTKCVELGRASLRLGDVSGKGEFQLRLSHKGLPAGTVVLQAAPCLGSALSELNGPGLATAQAPLSVPPPGLAQSQTLASASFALAPPALATPPQPLATPAPYVDRALPPTFAPHHAASLPPHLAAVAAAPAAAPWPAPLAGAAPPWPPPAPPRPAVVPSCPPAPAPSSAAAPRPQQPALGPQRALAQPSSLPHHSTLPAGALGLRAASPRVLMLLVDGSASMLRPCGWDEALLRAEFAFAVLRHVVAALARCTGSRTGLRTVAVAAQGSEADMGYMTVEGAEALWQRLLWTGEHTLSAGWGALYGAYARESGACAPLLALLVTDGPPRDAAALGAALGAQGGAHLLVALFGEGPDHDAGWAAWCALAAANPRVRALSFAGETSAAAAAESVCRQLLH